MNDQLRPLSARIRIELVELARVLHRVEEGWQRAQRAADDDYLDSVALHLPGFYSVWNGSLSALPQWWMGRSQQEKTGIRPYWNT